jgi:DNA-binding MarR family transcriptional regulator
MQVTNNDHALWELISLLRDTILKIRTNDLRAYNITPRQFFVLSTIYEFGYDATFKKISKHVFREPNSISEQITRMGNKGLLKKIKNANEATLTRFELTEKGLEVMRFAGEEESLHKILSVLSSEEHQQLTSLVEKLLAKARELYL